MMLAVLTMVEPGASPKLAFTTSGKLAEAFAARDAMVQVIGPVPPTVGSVPQLHPEGTPRETKVAPVGIVSVKVAVPEAAGPPFATSCA